MHTEGTKRFYKVSEVVALLGVPPSTLRYWESVFPRLAPRRSTSSNHRLYDAADLRRLRLIKYLLHDKGMKIEAAKKHLNDNPTDITREAEAVTRLQQVRDRLQHLIDALAQPDA